MTDQAHEVVLVGLEPGATLFGLQLQEELNGFVWEPGEALRRDGHGRRSVRQLD